MANICERVKNILTCKNLDNRTISINLDNIDYWVEDNDPNIIELHIKNNNYSLWLNISEKKFRAEYLKYKKENE